MGKVTISIDGIYNPYIYKYIEPHIYKGPECIVKEFKGVPIEYVLSEKNIAITNELRRPKNHRSFSLLI